MCGARHARPPGCGVAPSADWPSCGARELARTVRDRARTYGAEDVRPVPNRGRQWRAARSDASPLHAGLAMAARKPGRLMNARFEALRGARGGSGAPPVQPPRGRRGGDRRPTRDPRSQGPAPEAGAVTLAGCSVSGCGLRYGTSGHCTCFGAVGPASSGRKTSDRSARDSGMGSSAFGSRCL